MNHSETPNDTKLISYCGFYCGACPKFTKGQCEGYKTSHKKECHPKNYLGWHIEVILYRQYFLKKLHIEAIIYHSLSDAQSTI